MTCTSWPSSALTSSVKLTWNTLRSGPSTSTSTSISPSVSQPTTPSGTW